MGKKKRMNVKKLMDSKDATNILLEKVEMNPSLIKKMIEDAEHADLRKMLHLFRSTQYSKLFLKYLLELPLEVWSEHHLQAEYLVEELEPEEKKWLLAQHWNAAELRQNPIIAFLLLEQKQR